MPLITIAASIILLIFLMTVLKFNAFLALIVSSFAVGLLGGLRAEDVIASMLTGMGDTMGSLVLILVFGAMLGKLIEESGAALSITGALRRVFGENHMQAVFIVTGFLVGLPMIYNASFLVLIPLAYAWAATSRKSLLWFGIPMSASLSVAHGFLPPHPAPTAVCSLYSADVNMTLLYGLIPCIPAIILAGPVLSRIFKGIHIDPPKEYVHPDIPYDKLPGVGISLLTALLPVVLMLASAAVTFVMGNNAHSPLTTLAHVLGDPNVALFLAVMLGCYILGIRRGRKMSDVVKSLEQSTGSIAIVILVIAGGGAFKQVLLDTGTADYIKDLAMNFHFNPLLMAWIVAALLRLAVGSATVATITAAGIMLPLVQGSGVTPELMVLATCSGSLMFSHFNDVGFWMFKEYYGVTIKQTFLIWTVMESIVAVVGLAAVFLLQWAGF